jgi:tRNA pseudouridine38-40 synthase
MPDGVFGVQGAGWLSVISALTLSTPLPSLPPYPSTHQIQTMLPYSYMHNLKLTIAYDGSDFHGWQRQPGVRTVETELQTGLVRLLREDISFCAASRTDAGVHALGQTVNFFTASALEPERILHAANTYTPADISVREVREVPESFNSTRDALGKQYRYELWLSDVDDPLTRHVHWWLREKLDFAAMRAVCPLLHGERDFRGLQVVSGKPDEAPVRTVHSVTVERAGPRVVIDVRGKSFMYKMVRSMVGLLVAVGRGRVNVDDVPALLTGDPTARRSEVVPPHGLTLMEVYYGTGKGVAG